MEEGERKPSSSIAIHMALYNAYHNFSRETLNNSASAEQRIFRPTGKYEKREIDTVFPPFPYLPVSRDLSLPAFASLFRASLGKSIAVGSGGGVVTF